MNIATRHLRLLACSALIAAVPFGTAHAQNIDGALERLKALVEQQGIVFDWASQNVSGSNVVLVGASVGTADEMVPVGDITLTNIADDANGYRVDSISFDDVDMDDGEGSSFSMSGVELGDVLIPNEGQQDFYGGFLFYETAKVDSIEVNVQGVDVFTMADALVETSFPENGSPMDFTGTIEEFTVDLSILEGTEQYPIIQALGYEQFDGRMEMAGSWQPNDGRLTMSQNDITITDAGTLGFALDLGGYTPAFIAALRDIQQQMAADPEGDNTAQGFAILGLMQQLTFHNAEIAFDDDSITNKVLELVGQMQGMSASDVANMAKAMVPFGLAQLNDPDFTRATTQAISAYLDNPQSLRIRAEPTEPVPFAMLIAEGMSTPQALLKTLNVRVTAND